MLRDDIAHALASGEATPTGVLLTAERASITLSVNLIGETAPGTKSQFVVLPNATGPHQVTVEFALGGQSQVTGSKPVIPEALPVAPSTTDLEALATSLSGIFGNPGFDSSARATVFRENLTELNPEEAASLIATLGDLPPANETPAAGKARLRIKRLAALVSAEPEAALKSFAQCASHFPVKEIIELAAKRWKTQDDWITR